MTCTAGDIACRLDAITAALQAGPSGWDIAGVLVAAVGVLASFGVALAALKSSSRAVGIAETSDKREAQRDEARDRDRVDRWLADFLVEAAVYREAMTAYLPRATDIEMHAMFTGEDLDERAYSGAPGAGRMLAALEAARLVAHGDDEETLGLIAAYARLIETVDFPRQVQVTGRLAAEIRDWRNGTSTQRALIQWMQSEPLARSASDE